MLIGFVRSYYDRPFFIFIFSPVCRSLCRQVQAGCESTMNSYGFPWPKMLECDNFPEDNDMCIRKRLKSATTLKRPFKPFIFLPKLVHVTSCSKFIRSKQVLNLKVPRQVRNYLLGVAGN